MGKNMTKYCFGIDLGGTTIQLGLFDEHGKCILKNELPTRKELQGKFILDDIATQIEAMLLETKLSKDEIIGVGIGVPGPVVKEAVVLNCVNIGWGTFDVAAELSHKCGLKVKVANDANVAALGELWCGSAKDYNDAVMITLGTGVGGGIIKDGRIVEGADAAAGEIGHMPIVYGMKERCTCGNRGCLEQVASATGIVKLAKEYLENSDVMSALRGISNLSAKDIFDKAKENDKLACSIVKEVLEYLATAMANISCVINPQIFVIGGGMSKAGDYLIDILQKYYEDKAFLPAKTTKIVLAKLGSEAGMYGAARLVMTV